jgi:nicotinamidase-related amidase
MNVYAEFLRREDCALLLVDIQEIMLGPCVNGDRVRKNSAALIDIAAIFDIPVLFSVHNAEKLGGFLPELIRKVPNPHVFNKVEFSCFENEAIARTVEKTGRRTLLIAGLEGHVCIFHTAAHALRLGYTVHVAADAVSSRSELNRDVGLRRLENSGAVISSTEMIIYELLNRAGTPEFRSALPLLKTL